MPRIKYKAWGDSGTSPTARRGTGVRGFGDEVDKVVVVQDAASAVFEATGEPNGLWRVWSDPPDRVRRLWARARLDGDPHGGAAVVRGPERSGAPFDGDRPWLGEGIRGCRAGDRGAVPRRRGAAAPRRGWQPGGRFRTSTCASSAPRTRWSGTGQRSLNMTCCARRSSACRGWPVGPSPTQCRVRQPWP